MQSKSEKYFTEVTIAFAKHHDNIFEARDLFEDELLNFLREIQGKLNLKWHWGWDCRNRDPEEYSDYDELVDHKPFFINNKSRIYLYDYDAKKQYYAHFGFGFDIIKNKGRGICFFTSIADDEGDESVLKSKGKFIRETLYNGEAMLYGYNISIEEVTLDQAVTEVNNLIKAWNNFKKERRKR